MNEQWLFLGSVTGAASFAGYWLSRLLLTRGESGKVRERLGVTATPAAAAAAAKLKVPQGRQVKAIVSRVLQQAAKPFMPETRQGQSALRLKLNRAGIYAPGAMRLVSGAKVFGLVIGPAFGYVMGVLTDALFLWISFGALAGFLAPMMWLRLAIRKHQQALEYGLPDALDLMCVCVEAGLGIDAAMQRIGQELSLAHPRLSRELEITHMEGRIGVSRTEALRNLGQRTGSPSVQSLTSMLIQAERFGTSVAASLRIHAESLRLNRQYRAEELAAKASVKMSFPLVMFIFPATFIVLAGPTFIELMRSELFK